MLMAKKPRAALVSMPWTSVSDPSLGLAILKAQLNREGIEARVFNFHVNLLRYVTNATYHQVASCWALNEFVFTGALDPEIGEDQVACLFERAGANLNPVDSMLPYKNALEFGRALIRLRHEVAPLYLAECAAAVLDYQPTFVGFTCMFDQTMASAAVARLVREQAPDTCIVFGGYAVEGPPGRQVLRAFPFVDAVAEGDGEPIIGALVRSSACDGRIDEVAGVITRANKGRNPRQKYELDQSPTPDYDDWFRDLGQLKERDRVTVLTTLLPVESSRGCWWGQKHHCVFCGIDENTLSYRQKRPETVLAQLSELRAKHGADAPFRFSDYILPQNYMRTLLPMLAQIKPRYQLQCEIKANQSEERMHAFAEAGFTELQPGIESFSTDVLNLMEKGVRGIQNVQTLKSAYLNGILLHYNLIWGIPGEKPEAYRDMLAQLPRLYHLTPPVSRTEAIVTRYAPLHMQPERFGADGAKAVHHRCYDALFSESFLERTRFSLDDYAYYFERYFDYDPLGECFYQLLTKCVDHWKKLHRERDVYLTWEHEDECLRVRDNRFGDPMEISLEPLTSAVYLACDRAPRSLSAIVRELSLPADEVRRALATLDQLRLIWREGGDAVGLATPADICQAHTARQWTRDWASVYC